MLIIEGRSKSSSYKPTNTRVQVDAHTHEGVIEWSVVVGADNKLTPVMRDLSGHPFVREKDNRQYIRIMRKSVITVRLPANSNYTLTKSGLFLLQKKDDAEFYAVECDEDTDDVREFKLHAHSTYKPQSDPQVHPFDFEIKIQPTGTGPDFTGREVALVDPDIKNPPPVGQ